MIDRELNRLNGRRAVICCPTSPNTAIVKAGSAVSDPVDGSRLALFDPRVQQAW